MRMATAAGKLASACNLLLRHSSPPSPLPQFKAGPPEVLCFVRMQHHFTPCGLYSSSEAFAWPNRCHCNGLEGS
jgi:hypothetical protein